MGDDIGDKMKEHGEAFAGFLGDVEANILGPIAAQSVGPEGFVENFQGGICVASHIGVLHEPPFVRL